MTFPPKKRLPDSLQKAAADRAAEVYKRCINDEAPLHDHRTCQAGYYPSISPSPGRSLAPLTLRPARIHEINFPARQNAKLSTASARSCHLASAVAPHAYGWFHP